MLPHLPASPRGVTTAALLGRGSIVTGRRAATAERALLDAASTIVGERGLGALSTSRIGAAASAHFGGRAALLDTLTKDLQDRFQPPAPEGDGLTRLLAAADAYVRQSRPESRVFIGLWTDALAGEPDLRDAFVARDARFRATLGGYLRDGVDDGTIRADVETDALASMLVGQLRMAVLQETGDAALGVLERGLRA